MKNQTVTPLDMLHELLFCPEEPLIADLYTAFAVDDATQFTIDFGDSVTYEAELVYCEPFAQSTIRSFVFTLDKLPGETFAATVYVSFRGKVTTSSSHLMLTRVIKQVTTTVTHEWVGLGSSTRVRDMEQSSSTVS